MRTLGEELQGRIQQRLVLQTQSRAGRVQLSLPVPPAPPRGASRTFCSLPPPGLAHFSSLGLECFSVPPPCRLNGGDSSSRKPPQPPSHAHSHHTSFPQLILQDRPPQGHLMPPPPCRGCCRKLKALCSP